MNALHMAREQERHSVRAWKASKGNPGEGLVLGLEDGTTALCGYGEIRRKTPRREGRKDRPETEDSHILRDR